MTNKRDHCRESGSCLRCGKLRINGTKWHCRECAKVISKEASKRKAEVRKKRLDEGLCYTCGGPKEGPKINCESCRKKFNDYMRKRKSI